MADRHHHHHATTAHIWKRWWVCTGSMHVDSAFHIFPHLLEYSWTFTPQTSPAILFDFTNLRRSSASFGRLQYFNVLKVWISCTHDHHLRILYHVSMHQASTHFQIFNTSYPHATTLSKNLRGYAYPYPIAFPKLQVHHPTSLNILPFQSMLTPNIWYYSHTPCRLLIGSSKTFGPSSFYFLSTPDTLVHISEDFYCAKLCTGTHSSIYPFPSIQPLCLQPFEV